MRLSEGDTYHFDRVSVCYSTSNRVTACLNDVSNLRSLRFVGR